MFFIKEHFNLKLFYFVFGHWDSGPHNIIIQKKHNQTHLFAIDNSSIRNRQYVRYGELPFVRFCYSERLKTNDYSDPFPFDKVNYIKNREPDTFKMAFGSKLLASDLQRLTNQSGPLNYVFYHDALWIQFHKNNPDFVLSHTQYYPKASIAALKKLNLKVLKQIFSGAQEAGFNTEFLTPKYIDSILERRDQVLKAAKQVSQHAYKQAA